VLAEVDYFLRDERDAMQVFMQDLAPGAFTYAPSTSSHGRWNWTDAARISARASSMVRWCRSPSRSASGDWRRGTRATSPRFDSATGRSFELVVRPTNPDTA
jgi:hypothetical protein